MAGCHGIFEPGNTSFKAQNGSDKQEKFGRYLGVIWLDGTNVNDLFVSKDYAVHREY